MHEDLTRRHEMRPGSERAFGLVMVAGTMLMAMAPLGHGQPIRSWLFVISAVFLGVAVARPRALRPLNLAWTKAGELLSRVTSPVILGVVFYGVIVPLGLIMRMGGRDALRLKRAPAASSYWQPPTPPTSASSMKQQF